MPAYVYDITIEQGATFQREFTVTQRGLDLPSFNTYSGRGMVRSSAGLLLATFTVTITGPRTILVQLSATVTTALTPAKNCKYDVEVQSPSGIVYRIAQGKATIVEEQTRT